MSDRLLHTGTRNTVFDSIELEHRKLVAACNPLWFELARFLAGIQSYIVDPPDTFRAPSNTRDHIDHLYIWNSRELQDSKLVTISPISGFH